MILSTSFKLYALHFYAGSSFPLSFLLYALRTTRLDGPLVSYTHMPACQQPAGPHPPCLTLGRQPGRMQQGRSQPGTRQRRSKTHAAAPRGPGPAPGGPGPLQLFCCDAGWCLAGCGLLQKSCLPKARHCGWGPAGCWHAGMYLGRKLVAHQAA